MSFCHIAASCLLTYASVAFHTLHYGSISRGVAIPRALKYCGGRRMIVGAPKSPNTVTSTFFNTVDLLLEDLRLEHGGGQTCFLLRATSGLVTPLSIRRLVPSRNSPTHFYVAKLQCKQTADSRTALATALKLVSRFQLVGLQNLESVTSFPYCVPVFTAAFPFQAVIRH